MIRILFLCSANISRSPLAEYYLRHLAGILGEEQLLVESAGILGIEGHRADPVMAAIARRHGIDMSDHRSRGVDARMLRRADEIYVMERRHRAFLRERFPDVLPRTDLLGNHLPGDERGEIPDPTGGHRDGYEEVARRIFSAVEQLAMRLKYPR